MLIVNGSQMEVERGMLLGDLLIEMELDTQPCAVEVNKELVPYKERSHVVLIDGDNVEIVTLVGGG